MPTPRTHSPGLAVDGSLELEDRHGRATLAGLGDVVELRVTGFRQARALARLAPWRRVRRMLGTTGLSTTVRVRERTVVYRSRIAWMSLPAALLEASVRATRRAVSRRDQSR